MRTSILISAATLWIPIACGAESGSSAAKWDTFVAGESSSSRARDVVDSNGEISAAETFAAGRAAPEKIVRAVKKNVWTAPGERETSAEAAAIPTRERSASDVVAAPPETRKQSDTSSCAGSESSPRAADEWLESFAEDDVFALSSVAASAIGDAIVARASGGMVAIFADGRTRWSKPFGSVIATDPIGNVYVAGTFATEIDLDGTTLVSVGGTDVFVAKLDRDGRVLRAVRLGGLDDDEALSLAVAKDGSAIVSGPGLGTARLDSAGALSWQRAFFGHVAVTSLGNVVITGALVGTVDFGGGPLTSAGGEDVFVASLDASGDPVWSRRFGDAGRAQRGESIAVDESNAVLVGGVLDGSIDFGGGPLGVQPGSCPAEVPCPKAGFVLKLDAEGRHVWSRARSPVESVPGIAADAGGRVVVSAGEPGNVPPYRIPLLFALDGNGDPLWERAEWPMTGAGAGHRVAIDRCGSVFWSVSVRPSFDVAERSYVAKIRPQ